MQIKRLRLTGFKSFVDPADLRIEPGLTGIVGPNGCGKSNLLEALRWAMGENSAKSLRGAGMDDVIFAGTATRPARAFAEVSILAEQAGDEPELEIVRRIERGAGSAYRINGRDVRAKDVSLAFADAATGAHSPALVSQGRIGAIIAAKPAERRAMLEEAAGIAGLHVRRRDAEQKLRATENNLTRLDELISDQEARAASLKRQARQAERYREITEQIRVAEARMIFARWRDAAAAAEQAKADAESAQQQVRACSAAQEHALKLQTSNAADVANARANALALRDQLTDAMHQLATLRGKRSGIDRRLRELSEAESQLAQDRGREDALAKDAAQALARLAEEAIALDAQIAAVQGKAPGLDAALAEAERAGRDAEVALAQALAAQASEAAEARVAEAALASAVHRLDRAKAEQQRVDAEIAALGDAAPYRAQKEAAAKARGDAVHRAECARAALGAADAEEKQAIEARSTAQDARATAHAEQAQLESEAAALAKATRPSERSRLLDQVTVAPGYEHALAAALGDDLEAGLDPHAERFWQKADALPDDPKPPAGLSALYAHVEAPSALARRLQQIFVASEDLGAPLAQGQRLVTLDGALRRWDGYVSRSGGAAAAERLVRINRLRVIETELPEAVAALAAADATLARIDAGIAAIRQQRIEQRQHLEAAENAASEASRAEDRAIAQLERLTAQRSDLEQRSARASAELAEAVSEHACAETAQSQLPDGSKMTAKVAELSRDGDAKRSAVATLRAERTALDRELAQAKERHVATLRDQKGWESRAGEAARRNNEMEQRGSALADERAILASRPAKLDREIADAEQLSERLRAALSEAQAHVEEAEAQLKQTDEAVRAANEALSSAREQRAGTVARVENHESRRIEMGRLSGERFECPPPLLPERAGFAGDSVSNPQAESVLHERLLRDRERIGPVNLVAESELTELQAAFTENARERSELAQAVERLRGSIGLLNREGRQRLTTAFTAVDGHFRRLFSTLFNGGQAHLALIDSDDPLEAGLEIMAQPPGKKLQSLTLLSGGEQALTAVALIFALFLTNPAPICVLDEVDAPLDDANIDRFCDLLDAMTRETATRYLIVTHNAATMSRMHRLFGVTMVEQGVSRLVSVDLGGAAQILAAE